MAVPEQLADNFFASFECENITINIKDILIFLTKNNKSPLKGEQHHF
jgi:hypothetical protein